MAFKKYISAASSVVLTASFAAANIPAKADEPVTAQITTTDRIVMDVELDEKMFLQDSSVYHHDIGMLALAFACSAYDTADTRGKGAFISDAYKALGFPEDKTAFFSYSSHKKNDPYKTEGMADDSLAFSIVSKKLGDTTLMAITFRGTDDTNDTDVSKDLMSAFAASYLGGMAGSGFADFSNKAVKGLDAYIRNNPDITKAAEEDKLKILVTGHSLGAAGANLFGAYLDSDEFSLGKTAQDDIYVYTYASPTTASGELTKNDCSNIINIINRSDIVTDIPGQLITGADIFNAKLTYANASVVGQKRFFDSYEYKSLFDWAGHHSDRYINAAETEIDPDDFCITDLDHPELYSDSMVYTLAKLITDASEDTVFGVQSCVDIGGVRDSFEVFSVDEQKYILGTLEYGGRKYLMLISADSGENIPDNTETADDDYRRVFRTPYALYKDMKHTAENYISSHGGGEWGLIAAGAGTGGAAVNLVAADFSEENRQVCTYTFSPAKAVYYGVLSDKRSVQYAGIHNLHSSQDLTPPKDSQPFDKAELFSQYGHSYTVNGLEGESLLQSYMDFAKSGKSSSFLSCAETDSLLISISGDGDITDTEKRGTINTTMRFAGSDKFILIPDGKDDIRLKQGSGDRTVITLNRAASENGPLKKWENVSLGGRDVRIVRSNGAENAKLLVFNSEGKAFLEILGDGSEIKYTERKGDEKFIKTAAVAGGGTFALFIPAVIGITRKKKRKKNLSDK